MGLLHNNFPRNVISMVEVVGGGGGVRILLMVVSNLWVIEVLEEYGCKAGDDTTASNWSGSRVLHADRSVTPCISYMCGYISLHQKPWYIKYHILEVTMVTNPRPYIKYLMRRWHNILRHSRKFYKFLRPTKPRLHTWFHKYVFIL